MARDRLKPVENDQEDQVQQEEPVYAEVHQEDPDAIEVIPEEPDVALEATPDVVSQAGTRAAAPLEMVLPPPKPRRLGWIRRGQGGTSSAPCRRRTSCQIPRPQRFELK
jgi:hypothetical protein